MTPSDRPELLRAELLRGVRIVVAGTGPSQGSRAQDSARIATAVTALCASLGASVAACTLLGEDGRQLDEPAIEKAAQRALGQLDALDLLVVDAAGVFAVHAQHGARAALVQCLDETWSIIRAVAARGLIASERGGRIVLVAPGVGEQDTPGEEHTDAALGALENLARTLSIEWARYAITTVTIAPGRRTTAGELAQLIAYLASPAGAYFSGCLLDLRGPIAEAR